MNLNQKKQRKAVFNPDQPTPVKRKKTEHADHTVTVGGIDEFEFWIKQNWKQTVTVILVIAVSAILILALVHFQAAQDAAVRQALATPRTITSIEEALAANGSHPAADEARLRLADLYIKNSDFKKACAILNDIAASQTADLYVRGRAAVNSAYLIEKQQDLPGAVLAFLAVSEKMGIPDPIRAEAAFSAARIYAIQGLDDQARGALSKINLSRADSGNRDAYTYWADRASELNDALKKKNLSTVTPSVSEPAASSEVKPADAAIPSTDAVPKAAAPEAPSAPQS